VRGKTCLIILQDFGDDGDSSSSSSSNSSSSRYTLFPLKNTCTHTSSHKQIYRGLPFLEICKIYNLYMNIDKIIGCVAKISSFNPKYMLFIYMTMCYFLGIQYTMVPVQ